MQSSENAGVAEGNSSDANSGGIVDRVGDGGHCRFERRLAGAVRRQVGAVRIRIAVDQHDIDSFRNVGVPKGGVGRPIPADHPPGVKADFLMKRATQAVKGAAFDGVMQAFRIDHQPAIVRAHDPPGPHMTGLSIHFDVGNLRLTEHRTQRCGSCR